MRIYIDVGHGNEGDVGAVNGSLIEHTMALETSYAMANRLAEHGAIVKIEEGNLSISDSAKAANAFKADLLLSQHYNAGGGDRGEAIYSIRKGSSWLADAILGGLKAAGQTSVRKYTKLNSAGNADYYGILRGANMPACIIEPCFIDNANDRTLADNVEKQQHIGVCIADSIAEAYGLAQVKEVEKVAKTSTPSEWAKEAAEWAVENGLIGGDNGNYKWQDTLTREQLAVILKRYHDKFNS